MAKSVNIIFEDEVLKAADEERKKKKISRNWLIGYLLKKWVKDGSKIIMED